MKRIKNLIIVFTTALFLSGFALYGIIKPDIRESVSERRPLASAPAVTADTILSGSFMDSFEKYAQDQFPLRERFRAVKSASELYVLQMKDYNKIYIKDGYISKLEFPMNTGSIDYAAQRFRFIYDNCLKDNNSNIYLSVIPDKNYFMASQNGYPSMDYDLFISRLTKRTDFAEYIDITGQLELSDYYRTDTHWRQEKLPDIAGFIAQKMDVTLSGSYTECSADIPFYGVYYGQCALPVRADSLHYLENSYINQYRVYDFETETYIPVYNLEKIHGNDPYEIFLSGSKSLISIENPASETDRELIIFRDSFGSSIAPLLAEGYSKVTLIDIRYISPSVLDKFITFSGQDVLFLYSTSVLNNSIMLK